MPVFIVFVVPGVYVYLILNEIVHLRAAISMSLGPGAGMLPIRLHGFSAAV